MSNLDIARAALVFARDGLHEFKSANKIHTKVEKSLEKKRNLGEVDATIFRMSKSQGFGRIENLRPSPGVRMAAVIAHGRAALKERAGNCQEYTAVVCHYLDMVHPRPLFDAVYFEPPGDHTFTVIGQQAGKDGAFPMDFAHWNADAAICDPWANLCCWARDYPNEWRYKMRKWEGDGKKVSMAGVQYIDGVAVAQPDIASPLKDSWYDAPDRYRKLSFTHRKKEKCYVTNAVCGSLGLPDDCEALSRMRAFRDDVLLHTPEGRRDVAAYYATAPAIVAAIDRSADPFAAYRELHERWLEPAVRALREGRAEAAYELYKAMVSAAKSRYGA